MAAGDFVGYNQEPGAAPRPGAGRFWLFLRRALMLLMDARRKPSPSSPPRYARQSSLASARCLIAGTTRG